MVLLAGAWFDLISGRWYPFVTRHFQRGRQGNEGSVAAPLAGAVFVEGRVVRVGGWDRVRDDPRRWWRLYRVQADREGGGAADRPVASLGEPSRPLHARRNRGLVEPSGPARAGRPGGAEG